MLLGQACEWSLWRGGHFIEVVFMTGLTVHTIYKSVLQLITSPKFAHHQKQNPEMIP